MRSRPAASVPARRRWGRRRASSARPSGEGRRSRRLCRRCRERVHRADLGGGHGRRRGRRLRRRRVGDGAADRPEFAIASRGGGTFTSCSFGRCPCGPVNLPSESSSVSIAFRSRLRYSRSYFSSASTSAFRVSRRDERSWTSLSSRCRSFSAIRREVSSASVTRLWAFVSDSSRIVRARCCASAIASSAVFCASTRVRCSISSVSRLLPALPSALERRSVSCRTRSVRPSTVEAARSSNSSTSSR